MLIKPTVRMKSAEDSSEEYEKYSIEGIGAKRRKKYFSRLHFAAAADSTYQQIKLIKRVGESEMETNLNSASD